MSESLPTGIRRKGKNLFEIRLKHKGKSYSKYAKTVSEAIRIRAEMKTQFLFHDSDDRQAMKSEE